MAEDTITLRESAERLGVHYMTAYRYVRLGMLPAVKVGGEWRVSEADIASFRLRSGAASTRPTSRNAPWDRRLAARLVAGDESGAWKVVEAAMASGLEPIDLHRKVIVPAMKAIGVDWEHGERTIAEEHRATAIATRLVARLGSRLRPRGRRRGMVVLGTPPGERHALAVAIVGDFFRAAGYEVVDLGCDIPVQEFAGAVADVDEPLAIAISVTNPASTRQVKALIAALRDVTAAPIMVGGGGFGDEAQAMRIGADAYAATADAAVAVLTGFAGRSRSA